MSVENGIVARGTAGQTLKELASSLNDINIKPERGEQRYANSVPYLL